MPSRVPRALLLAPVLTVALMSPAAAHASDRGLQRTVVREENKTLPVAYAYRLSNKAYADDPAATPDDLLARTGTFRHRLQAFKNAVTPIDAVSADSNAGKKQLLTALREYDIGLANFRKALKRIQDGVTTRRAVKANLVTYIKRVRAAAVDEASALKLLRIRYVVKK